MNKAKTKIFAIVAAITILLSGCNSKTNEQPDINANPSTSVSVITPEENKDNTTEQTIETKEDTNQDQEETSQISDQEETYKGEELTVLSVYNPLEEKENYYFVKMLPSNSSYTPSKENSQLAFKGTPLEESIENDNAETIYDYYMYQSVLDDNVTYTSTYYISNSTDGYSGLISRESLQTEEIHYLSNHRSVYSDTEMFVYEHTSFAVNNTDKTVYMEYDDTEEAKSKYDITYQTFIDAVVWDSNAEYTKSELQEMQDNLNKGYTLQKTNE